MNREIKFRAWDGQQMVDVVDLLMYDEGRYRINEDVESHYAQWPLMQFTGLRDKAGKGNDVYEGDTFEAIYKDCPDGYSIMGMETTVIRIRATVVFRWGKFMVEMMHPELKELVYSTLSSFLKNDEKVVFGNIYQTPEKAET